MSIPTSVLGFFRTQWADRFTDSCIVKRTTGTTLNQTTGQYEPTYTENYDGPCLVRPISPSDVVIGQEQVGVLGYNVFLPYTETDQEKGDLVDVTSATDARLTGKQFVVNGVDADTYITKRTLTCEDVG